MVKDKPLKRQRTDSPSHPDSSEGSSERNARLEASSEHINNEHGSRGKNSSDNNRSDLANTVWAQLPEQINDDSRRLNKDKIRNYLNDLLVIINELYHREKIDDFEWPNSKEVLLHVQNRVRCSKYIPSETVVDSIENLLYWICENSFISDELATKKAKRGLGTTISLSTVVKLLQPLEKRCITDGIYNELKNECFHQNKIITVFKLACAIEHSTRIFLNSYVPEKKAISVKTLYAFLREFFTSFDVDNLLAEEITTIDKIYNECSNNQCYGKMKNIIRDWIVYFQLASIEKQEKKNTDIRYLAVLIEFHHFFNRGSDKPAELMQILEQELQNAENRRLVVPRRHFKNLAQQAIKSFVPNKKKVEFHAYHEGVWNKSGKSFEKLIGKEEKEEELSNEDEDDTIIGLEEYIAEFTKMEPYEKMPKTLVQTHIIKNVSSMVHGAGRNTHRVQYLHCRWAVVFRRNGNNMSFFLICQNSKTEPWQIDVNVSLKVISEGGTEWEKKLDVVTLKHGMDYQRIGFRDFMEWGRMETEYLWNDQLLLKAEVTFTRMEGFSREKLSSFEAKTDYADAVLVAGGEKFHIARAMLAPQSTYFKDLFSDDQRKWKVYEMNIENVDRKDWQCFLEMCHLAPAVNDSNVEGVLCLSKEVGTQNITRMAEEFLLSDRSYHSMAKKLELAAQFGLINLRMRVLGNLRTRLELRAVDTKRLRDFDPSVAEDITCKSFSMN